MGDSAVVVSQQFNSVRYLAEIFPLRHPLLLQRQQLENISNLTKKDSPSRILPLLKLLEFNFEVLFRAFKPI